MTGVKRTFVILVIELASRKLCSICLCGGTSLVFQSHTRSWYTIKGYAIDMERQEYGQCSIGCAHMNHAML